VTGPPGPHEVEIIDGSLDGSIRHAVETLRQGGLVAFPTETVYGLGADAGNAEAVAKVFAVKGRPSGHPLIVHLANADQLGAWAVDVPPAATRLADAFWPGPLTMVLRRSRRVADAVTGGRATVALRVPSHSVAHELLSAFGGGIAAPSANRFGRVSPTTAGHVRADLGHDIGVILDGGPSVVGVESTIIDLTGDRPDVLRLGGVTVDALADVLGVPRAALDAGWSAAPGATTAAPGTLAAHYSPAAEVRVVDDATLLAAEVRRIGPAAVGRRIGVLASDAIAGSVLETLPIELIELEPAGDADHFASVLYARLRQADRLGFDTLFVLPPAGDGIAAAVRDRLRRAAAGSRRIASPT